MTTSTSSPKPKPVEPRAARRPVVFFDAPTAVRQAWESALNADVSFIWTSTIDVAVAESVRSDGPVLVSFVRPTAALAFMRELRQHKPTAAVLAVIDASRSDLAVEATLAGAADVLTSDASPTRVAASIRACDSNLSAIPGAADAARELYAFSPAMREVTVEIARAASASGGVLLVGERGTGRAAVARAVHEKSNRPGPFVVVDCANHDAQQLARELFGTPTSDDEGLPARSLECLSRDGRLYAALGGTLLLRNVLDAPARVQHRLSTLLRDREATILETGSAVAFDVRCMAAAEGSIEAATHDGRVLPDLFRRLSTTTIHVPPLRNRREDIAPLANRFMRQACADLGVRVKLFARSSIALLTALPWNGNAAELKTLIRDIVAAHDGQGLGVDTLLAHVRLDASTVMIANRGTLREARERFEREYIAASLRLHRGRVTRAAKALGIQRANLYRKMRSLQVMPTR